MNTIAIVAWEFLKDKISKFSLIFIFDLSLEKTLIFGYKVIIGQRACT